MKKIEAIVRPSRLEAVKEAIQEAGATGLHVSEVRGFGRQKGHTELYRGSEYKVDFIPKVKLETVVPDEIVSQVISAIQSSAKTGGIGDGKIFVIDVIEALRVRTGERGESAL